MVYLKEIDESSYKDGNIVAVVSADSGSRKVDEYYVDSKDTSSKEIELCDSSRSWRYDVCEQNQQEDKYTCKRVGADGINECGRRKKCRFYL